MPIRVFTTNWYSFIFPVAKTKSANPAFMLLISILIIRSLMNRIANGGISFNQIPIIVSGTRRNGTEMKSMAKYVTLDDRHTRFRHLD